MKLTSLSSLIWLVGGLSVVTLLVVKAEIIGIAMVLGLAFVSALLYKLFTIPRLGIILLVIQGFTVIGITRYVPAPLGLSVDGVLVLLYLALFFKAFTKKIQWSKAKSHLTILVGLWMGYIFLQVGNPEAQSVAAWFYAMRGLALYQFLAIPLAFILFSKPKDLNTFFLVWGVMSIIGTLKGVMQYTMGVDPFEQAWLNAGSYKTHILFGKLRVFSFYSDAGQFGAAQGHAGVVFGILALFRKQASLKLRAFYLTVAFMGLFGMLISGTRGAIAVPGMGGIVYLILSKNIRMLTLGAIFGLSVYIFFAHTTLLQSNPEVRRMRTAFDPNDASLQVRLANQRKLKSYLASRPIGGGVGATGNWGQRFTPHTFLANTATDSWYVMIWADTGVVGLWYYLFMLFYILITGGYNVMFRIKNEDYRIMLTAITCGFAGIMMASYGNGVFGQMPTGILMYLSMVFMFAAPRWNKEEESTEEIEKSIEK
ncbi:MAG: hypothetical protein CMB99_08060 [Flavobacteriaceae bacterium]|nr:hypothetical protein [Flavobacteriaceae bacterium]|tara:strand:- start:140862 stop:142307 length:1446 start_codon:yes stop_codon:yes gene_type:complete